VTKKREPKALPTLADGERAAYTAVCSGSNGVPLPSSKNASRSNKPAPPTCGSPRTAESMAIATSRSWR
jgi:hypothetical protein